jgi:phospholipid/cholesterol/gamma-HCH transport system substrate-binding protein
VAIFTRTREDVEAAAPAAPPAGNGHGGNGRPRRLRRRALRWGWLVMAAVVVAGTLLGVEESGGTATYPVTAVFAQAPGLFPGAAVEQLGVPVGTVTSVRNVGDEVLVGLAIDHGRAVPAQAQASLVSPQILGEPSIELEPGYTGGPTLRSGATIPIGRTAVPVSTERVLKSLEAMLKKVNPHAVGHLVTNLADDLQGEGKTLNKLIAGAAGTLKVLATKADDLGQLSGSLAQLTGTLDSRTSQITQLITDYDTVSGVIAQHSAQLGGAVTQLSEASTQLVQLLVPDLAPIESDVGSVTRVGRTLDRNLTSVDKTLSSASALFAGAERAYTPTYNWLTLNSQLPTGLTGAILAGLVEHRLEGVCRRVLAHHATALTAKQRQTLATCGSQSSSFFGPIVNQIPAVLNDVSAGKLPTASPAQMFKQGLAKIPGASGTKTPSTSPSAPSPGSTSKGSGGTTGSTKGSSSTSKTTKTSTTKKKKKTCLGGLLGTTVTCTTGSSTSGSGTGSGGLLAYHSPSSKSSTTRTPTDTHTQTRPYAPTPTLTAAATRDLPPLPASAPGSHRTRPHRHPKRRRHGDRHAGHAGAAKARGGAGGRS